MNENYVDNIGSGIHYDAIVPLVWREQEQQLSDDEYAMLQIHKRNEELLRIFSTLDDTRVEMMEDHEALNHEIQRMDSKVNLLLTMMSKILTQQLSLPKPVRVCMSATGLSWEDKRSASIGSRLSLSLYLYDKYPCPLVFTGRVQAITTGEELNFINEVIFENLTEVETEELEKIVFRQHRRAVAQSKRNVQ